MSIDKVINVLIVDDSAVFRKVLSTEISVDEQIRVVATACDVYDARDKILEHQPDVMILDIEMPKMNGIDFLKKLLPQYSMKVIVTSSADNRVFDALNAGAVDFVSKPSSNQGTNMSTYSTEMIFKIKTAYIAKIKNKKTTSQIVGKKVLKNKKVDDKIIAIGASTGGTESILQVLKTFSNDIPGIVITQHMPPVFTNMYANRLNTLLSLEVKEAENGDIIKPGRVLLAPGDYQMSIKRTGSLYKVKCEKGPKVNGHRPSVDVLFESVAKYAGNNAIGIILTGMGRDGAKGLLSMRRKGAFTIGQDEASCIVYGMPKVAFNIGGVSKQAHLNDIGELVYSHLNK